MKLHNPFKNKPSTLRTAIMSVLYGVFILSLVKLGLIYPVMVIPIISLVVLINGIYCIIKVVNEITQSI
jgi:hypothetical protein